MENRQVAFVTPSAAPQWRRWLVYSPLARILIFVVLAVVLGFACNRLFTAIGWVGTGASPLQKGLVEFVFRALVPLVIYVLLVWKIEGRRHPAELAARRLLPDGLAGIVFGVVLFSAVVGVLWLLGSYHVIGTDPHASWLPALLTAGLGAGIGEEIIFRGVLYRMVEESLGTWWALGISAVFFGGVHFFNPGATLWAAVAIAIEAGVLFGLLYNLTGSLPLCMGLHMAWNFTQGKIYGIPVSGGATHGWLVSERTGPEWLSGGVFGAEASVVALLLCSVVSVILLTIILRRGGVVRPVWQRRQGLPAA